MTYEIAGTKEMRHFKREQITVERYQVEREFLTWHVTVNAFTLQYQLTDVQLHTNK